MWNDFRKYATKHLGINSMVLDDVAGAQAQYLNPYILEERLEQRSYTLRVKMMLHDEMDGQDAAVDEMLDVMKTPVLSTASFDARA